MSGTIPDIEGKQIDGNHYVNMGIQPWELIERAKLDYWEGNAAKYIMRWRTKDGFIDLEKAIHYVEKVMKRCVEGHYGPELKKQAEEYLRGKSESRKTA